MADEKRGNKVSDERQGTLGEERTMRDFPKLPNHPRFREIPREGGQLHYGYTTKQFLCDGGQWSDLNDLTARQRESAAAIAESWWYAEAKRCLDKITEADSTCAEFTANCWLKWGRESTPLPRAEEVAAAAVCGKPEILPLEKASYYAKEDLPACCIGFRRTGEIREVREGEYYLIESYGIPRVWKYGEYYLIESYGIPRVGKYVVGTGFPREIVVPAFPEINIGPGDVAAAKKEFRP